jgi:hypothetical protein
MSRGTFQRSNMRSWIVLSSLFLVSSSGGATDQRPALDVIVDAFATHALVAVGEAHGNVSDHEFRLSLIRDARLVSYTDTCA